MLRDFGSALILAAVTGALYALGMYLGPLHWNLGDDARDLLVGLMLSATGFSSSSWRVAAEPSAAPRHEGDGQSQPAPG